MRSSPTFHSSLTSLAACLLLVSTPLSPHEDSYDQTGSWSLSNEPYLVREAAALGIWPGMAPGEPGESNAALARRTQVAYSISNAANPYFVRGDFDSDGKGDLALLIRERSTDHIGIAIIPGSLERVHIFGVGPTPPAGGEGWKVVSLNVSAGDSDDEIVVGMKDGSGIRIRWEGGSFQTSTFESAPDERSEPWLVRRAREEGLWPAGIRYEILWDRNPSYIRGDFNGDGEFEVAVLVRDTSTRERGIVIVHSTLDTLYTIVGKQPGGGITDAGKILLIPKGEILRPFPEPEPLDPIELKTDAIWAGWPGAPYSGAWYWKDGRYRWVTLSD